MSTSSSTRRCIQFSLKEIKAATNEFDSSNFLGKGGEAMVYFAKIDIGSKKTPVAVKHLNVQRDNTKEFEREIQTLAKIQHPNIVSLIGYCNESGQKILVYEYMAKGCLSDYLKKNKDKSLSWLQRLNICLDVARGLQHLHGETDEYGKGIIHRDVKPRNILVGENWVGKLSDFGIIKLSNAGQVESSMATDRKGTSGYFAPEYHNSGCVTRKIDVFAFGVVLFQVLCEKMPWDRADESYYFHENDDLGIWAQENIDAQIRREMSGDSFTLFTDIIGRSLQWKPGKRPTMEKVVLDLEKVLLECQESENQPKQFVDTEETYLQPSSSKRPTIDDVMLNLPKVLDYKKSKNQPKQPEGSLRRCRQFSIKKIKAGTNNFDSSKIIGQDEESTVYFAEIYIGLKITPAAVKLLNENHPRKFEINHPRGFEILIHTLSKIQHPNLVSLIGYCNESGYKILVYEYIAKGFLSHYLEKGSCISFSWLERLNVCLGAACGLRYLHTETDEFPKGIVYRNVNPGNIFVGENWVVKLSNFKMFSIASKGKTLGTIIQGTVGYHAPEYMMLGVVTRKSDVYAFGVVLFEVLCRKLPWDREDQSYYHNKYEDLGIWAQENVDSQIRGEMSEKSLTLFTDIIGRSLQNKPGNRPSMNDVVLNIQKAIECQQEYENLAKQVEDKAAEKVNFLTKLVALKPWKNVREMIKNVMLGKDEGADNTSDNEESTNGGKKSSGITGKEYELTLADRTNPSSSNPIKEEVKGSGQDDKPTCQICKMRNHEAIDCPYRFDRSYQS